MVDEQLENFFIGHSSSHHESALAIIVDLVDVDVLVLDDQAIVVALEGYILVFPVIGGILTKKSGYRIFLAKPKQVDSIKIKKNCI